MKIALLGYGRMGKAVESIALQRGHEIVLKAKDANFDIEQLKQADAAIEFSIPDAAYNNIKTCIDNNIPVASGTTGWLSKKEEIEAYCTKNKAAFLYASNFSVGVNLFFELNRHLAKLMNGHDEYSIEMEEIHHTKKLDAPSGTAITLAEGIIDLNNSKTKWVDNTTNSGSEIPIVAKRIPDVPGTHSIIYNSEIDSIEIKHTAHNRKGFATGAVLAAEWLVGKTGNFTMRDLLALNTI